MMSYSLHTKEKGELYPSHHTKRITADQPMEIRVFIKQTSSPNASSCPHGVSVIMFERGWLSDLQDDPPSSALWAILVSLHDHIYSFGK